MGDHPRSQKKAVLIRLLPAEKEFIDAAVSKANDLRRGRAEPLSQREFVRNGAIQLAEEMLGERYDPMRVTKRKARA